MDAIDKQLLLEKILDLNYLPDGAYHIRKNGQDIERINTENISIVPKKGQAGIDVTVKPGTRGETIYLFSLMSQPVADLVYNTFEIGANANIVIMAGYTLTDPEIFQQQVVNKFIVQENAKLKYIEKHSVDGVCQRVLNQKNILSVEKSGIAELEVTQTQGGAKTIRQTEARLSQKAGLTILERLSTSLTQFLESSLDIDLAADDATAQVTLRSVAQQQSKQFFDFKLDGNAKCRGAVECNSIILDEAEVSYNPKITSFNADAQLLQNTTIGKISSDQLTKLMCWGLTENEAKNTILQGFLN